MLCTIFRVGQELQDIQPTWFMLWCPKKWYLLQLLQVVNRVGFVGSGHGKFPSSI